MSPCKGGERTGVAVEEVGTHHHIHHCLWKVFLLCVIPFIPKNIPCEAQGMC